MLNNVDRIGTVLVTDELPAYRCANAARFAGIGRKVSAHLHVNHSKGEYVRRDRHAAATAHVNTAESFNATLKRAWPDAERQSGVGVFHWFSIKHTDRYLHETSFRWNARLKDTDARQAGRKCGFPKPKKKFVREAGIYCVAQASAVDGQQAVLPKLGRVKLSGGDLGTSTLMTTFDGAEFEEVLAPKPLRRAQRRLKRAQRRLSRRKPGSNRRRAQARRVGLIHRKVRCIRQDALHQCSHRLTGKADVLKLETLNVAGMARSHRIALSIADAGMGRLVTFIHYKADWRGREVVQIDPWFPGSQTCCLCGARHKEMKNLSVRTMRCDCGNVMGRDRNAAVNHYRYPEERESRGLSPTRVEIGDQADSLRCPPVPFVETRMLTDVLAHESQ